MLRIRAVSDGNVVRIVFLDFGPGVGTNQLLRLFKRFYRGETSCNRANAGADLRLAICHSIALA